MFMSKKKFDELTDKYLKRLIALIGELVDYVEHPYFEKCCDFILDIVTETAKENSKVLFKYEVAIFEKSVVNAKEKRTDYYHKVIAGFATEEAAREYIKFLNDDTVIYSVLYGGIPIEKSHL